MASIVVGYVLGGNLLNASRVKLRGVETGDAYLAALRASEPEQMPRHRRFPGAVRADYGETFTLVYRQIEAAENLTPAD